jgi:uncharacterized protein (TIGR02145 family)
MTNLINILIFKNMKRMIFLMLAFLILGAASMNAQVRIGGLDDPHESALLDLNATDAANSGNLGLALPRVTLQSTEDQSTIPNPVAGLAVYNTTKVGSGATAVVPGIYVFTGTEWALQAPPVIITQPKSFSWSRLYEKDGDPNSTVTEFSPVLTVAASGAGLSYQWYKKAVNKNAADTLLISETNPTYTPTVTGWGMNSYYCVVSNAYGSVKSDVADVAAGCGAKTNDNTWLKFMCHNVGASPVGSDQSLDEITFDTNSTVAGGDTISSDAKGWLFQWGRVADGYQWRGSETEPGPVTLPDDDNPIPSDNPAYGKFITNGTIAPYDWRDPQRYFLWRNWNDGRFPCPSGWHIPSSSEWGSIYRTGSSYGTPDTATSNTWSWTATGKGYQIKPDGSTTTLFLPAAGTRRSIGVFVNVGLMGLYWHADANTQGSTCSFSSARVSPDAMNGRIAGFSVRCVSDQ